MVSFGFSRSHCTLFSGSLCPYSLLPFLFFSSSLFHCFSFSFQVCWSLCSLVLFSTVRLVHLFSCSVLFAFSLFCQRDSTYEHPTYCTLHRILDGDAHSAHHHVSFVIAKRFMCFCVCGTICCSFFVLFIICVLILKPRFTSQPCLWHGSDFFF